MSKIRIYPSSPDYKKVICELEDEPVKEEEGKINRPKEYQEAWMIQEQWYRLISSW